jgi:hypothetical protein
MPYRRHQRNVNIIEPRSSPVKNSDISPILRANRRRAAFIVRHFTDAAPEFERFSGQTVILSVNNLTIRRPRVA